MPIVVGVSFRKVGKVYYFDPCALELHEGDFVISETALGLEFGEVVLEPREVPDEEVVCPLRKVLRVANSEDLEREASNRDKEKRGFDVCEKKITEHGLPMKLLDAESSFDGSVITFSFSAEGRVDFRELVRDVAGELRTRVQLHQIGVRDEARIIGGYGGCGRPLCCSTFMTNFEPVSMKMAKDQSLFLNPAKFSGSCGKLLCCLKFEHDFYKSAQENLPAVGAVLHVDNMKGKVVDVNVISEVLTIETEEGAQIQAKVNNLKLGGICRRHGINCNFTTKDCHMLEGEPYEPVTTTKQNNDETYAAETPPRAEHRSEPKTSESLVSGIKFRDVSATSAKSPNPTPSRKTGKQDDSHRHSRQVREGAPKNRKKRRHSAPKRSNKPRRNDTADDK